MAVLAQLVVSQEVAPAARAGNRRGEAWEGSRVLAFGVLLYCAVASVLMMHRGVDPLSSIPELVPSLFMFFAMATLVVPWWGVALAVLPLVAIGAMRRRLWQQAGQILAAIFFCVAFLLMFGRVKSFLPNFVPFWADDLFTRADRFVHFGFAPRAFLSWLAPFNASLLETLYLNSWVFAATFFPVLLIAFDASRVRRRVFILLWLLCWIVLGNLLAVAFMSYGPIFADMFSGGDTGAHRDVLALLSQKEAGGLLAVKMHLWSAYSGSQNQLGSGISAFPSVHVGMATVFGLYIARLARDYSGKWPPALGGAQALLWGGRAIGGCCVGFYLVLSVYLGWHYALDGYASIAIMGAFYLALLRREARRGAACAPDFAAT